MVTTITPRIVTVNPTVDLAPSVSQLQQSGAIISLGGTTLTTNSYQYCGTLSAVTNILGASGNHAELLAMATTFFAQGQSVGLYVLELGTESVAGANIPALQSWITANSSPQVFYAYLVPAAWDGVEGVNSVTITNAGSGYVTAPTVTFSAPTSGTTATGTAVIQNGEVTQVIITNPGSGYTTAPTVTFSAAPTGGTTALGTTTLGSALGGIAYNYTAPSAKTYFFVTTTVANISQYATYKSVWAKVPAPTAPSTEFSTAADFYDFISTNPSLAAPAAPFAYRFQYGVTPWARTSANNASINTILTAYGNVTLTGAEGGISNAALFKGTLMDGNQAMFWYAIDWFQIRAQTALANAIINGSNGNPPLYYNQNGINVLQAVAQGIANTSVAYRLNLNATVSATPFYTYTTANPSDYAAGIYNGLSATITPQLGFLTITFNLAATQFVTGA